MSATNTKILPSILNNLSPSDQILADYHKKEKQVWIYHIKNPNIHQILNIKAILDINANRLDSLGKSFKKEEKDTDLSNQFLKELIFRRAIHVILMHKYQIFTNDQNDQVKEMYKNFYTFHDGEGILKEYVEQICSDNNMDQIKTQVLDWLFPLPQIDPDELDKILENSDIDPSKTDPALSNDWLFPLPQIDPDEIDKILENSDIDPSKTAPALPNMPMSITEKRNIFPKERYNNQKIPDSMIDPKEYLSGIESNSRKRKDTTNSDLIPKRKK